MSNLYKINTYSLIYILYFLLVFCLFFSTVAIIPTFISSLLQIVSIIFILFLFLFFIKLNFLKQKDILVCVCFILPILISQIYNVDNGANFPRFLLLSFIYPILFMVCLFVCKSFSILKIFKPFFISIGLISILSLIKIFGIYDFEFYSSSADVLDYYEDVQSRDRIIAVTGIYINQNTFAPILMAGIYSCIILFFYEKSKTYKLISVVFLIISSLLLLLTAARAPIFALFVGLSIFFIFSNISLKVKAFLMFSVSLVLVGFFYIGQYAELLLGKINDAGLSYRDIIWNDVFEKVSNNLFFGIGLGNYKFMDGYHIYSTHNLYLLFLVSLGIIGCLSIIFFIIASLKKCIEVFVYDRNSKAKLLSVGIVLSCLVHQMFEVILDNPLKPFALFFLVALSYLYVQNIQDAK